MKERLAKLLFTHSINNWKFFNSDNKLSIMLFSPYKFKVKDKNNYKSWKLEDELTIIGILERDFDKIIEDIKQFIIDNHSYVNNYTELITKVHQLKYCRTRELYQSGSEGSINLNKIRNYGFDVNKEWITWNSYIPIKVIFFGESIFFVDSDELKKLEYGASSFKIVNEPTFKSGVYCSGLHPNVSPNSNKLCCEPGTRDNKVTLENLLLIKGLLGHINLNYMYQPAIHMPKLEPFLKMESINAT